MKRVIDTEDIETIYEFQKKLQNNCYDCVIREFANKYELLVDENIFNDVMILLNLKSEKRIEKNRINNTYRKGTFFYIVEEYFQMKYFKLLIVSFVFSLIIGILSILYNFEKIGIGEKREVVFEIFLGVFALSFLFSQIVVHFTRFYRIILEIKSIFKIGLKRKYENEVFKIINFLLFLIFHIAWICFFAIIFIY